MLQIFRLNNFIFFILLIIAISIIFELMRRGKIATPYQNMKDKDSKKDESGYLFLNGSYYMRYPYVDDYTKF